MSHLSDHNQRALADLDRHLTRGDEPVDEPTVMQEAEALIYNDRREDYGEALVNFNRIAAGWTAILGKSVTAKDVALCMTWLKIARECDGSKRDNIVDAIGYLGLIEQMDLIDG
jgi:hypothetical protein